MRKALFRTRQHLPPYGSTSLIRQVVAAIEFLAMLFGAALALMTTCCLIAHA